MYERQARICVLLATSSLRKRTGGGNDFSSEWWSSSPGPPLRPIYQQIATAPHILGASGGGAEREQISLDIGYGAVGYARGDLSGFWFLLQDRMEVDCRTVKKPTVAVEKCCAERELA